MKKYLSIAIITCFIISNSRGQVVQTRSWSDGDTVFSQIAASQGVVIDSTIRLIPQYETHQPDSFQYILYGEDGIWPIQKFSISSAYDIDFLDEKSKKFYLVTDGFGRRVYEVNYTNPDDPIEAGFSFSGQAQPLINPVDASIFYENGDRKILVTDAGGNRVVKVDRLGGDEEWTYGDGNSGTGFNQLSGPSDAIAIPDTNLYLICDQGNSRVIMVEAENNIIQWMYGEVGTLNPVDIEYDAVAHSVLVTDRANHRVFMINIENSVVFWQFGTGTAGNTHYQLDSPTDADILSGGNILICDAGNKRLLEVNQDGEVVWSFEHRDLPNLRDADRLPDNRTIIVADYPPLLTNVPVWLGYSDSTFISDMMSINKLVNFDSLSWEGETPENTKIRLQIRTAANRTDLAVAPWRGPSNTNQFFSDSVSAVHPTAHLGHSYYQFKAILESSDTLHTPVLTNIALKYHYYSDKQPGTVSSTIISPAAGYIVTNWLYLNYNTIQRVARNIKVSLVNPQSGVVLKDFYAETIDTVQNRDALEIWDQLKGRQSLQLLATLSTKNTAMTPILQNWGLEWNSTLSSVAQLDFVNSTGEAVDHYRVSPVYPPVEKKVDQVFISLTDLNLAAVQASVTLQIRALRSGDEIDVLLERNPEGRFVLKYGIPAVIFNLSIPGNSFLEVFERDTLVVSYTDPTTASDTTVDSALIVQNSVGEIQIVNAQQVAVDTLSIGDSLYVFVNGESDRNITSAQDTISVQILNTQTDDQETISLVEMPDSTNHYTTGDFISIIGMPLVQNATGLKNDNQIQAMPANQIAVRYEDNVTLQDAIYVLRTGYTPPDSVFVLPTSALDFDVAPNPFYMDRHPVFRLKASSSIGDLRVERVEIYNLSGQKVRTIDGGSIRFDLAQPIPQNVFAYSENWWNFRNDNNETITSGMYFIKMYGAFSNGNGSVSESINAIRKVIIFR